MSDELTVSADAWAEFEAERERPGEPVPGLVELYRRYYASQNLEEALGARQEIDKAIDRQVIDAEDALVLLARLRRPRLSKAVKKVAKFLGLDENIVHEAMTRAIHDGRLVWTQDRHLEIPDAE